MGPGFTERVSENKRRALLLVVATAGVVGIVTCLISLLVVPALVAVAFAVVAGGVVAGLAWWGSEPLTRRLLGARPADPIAHARLFNLVEGLCTNAGILQPTLYVIDDQGLNALTMGRTPQRATLMATSGLLEGLTRMELEAVLAHELSHIKSDDILTATVAVVLFGLLGAPARAAAGRGAGAIAAYLLLPLSALAGLGLHWAADPQREEMADTSGVSLTRYPPALVTALEKMQRDGTVVRAGSAATAHLWLGAPVEVPSPQRLGWLSRLFDTHPPLEERIEALREL